jgi:hypothetical protein
MCIETPADHSGSVTKKLCATETLVDMELGSDGVCVTMYWGAYILFSTRIGLSLRNHSTFWDSECALGRIYLRFGAGTFDRRNVYIEKGRTAVAHASLAQ